MSFCRRDQRLYSPRSFHYYYYYYCRCLNSQSFVGSGASNFRRIRPPNCCELKTEE